MLRQLRLEMSLSQCGLAHTYPASETPYHCPGAPLCYLLTLPRGRMTEVFMTPPLREPSPPLNRINIKQQTSSIRSSVGWCHLTGVI